MPSQSPTEFELPTVSESTTNRHDETEAPFPSERGSVAGTTALFISETESAVQFRRDLFETLWADSDPIDPYIERQFPELWGVTLDLLCAETDLPTSFVISIDSDSSNCSGDAPYILHAQSDVFKSCQNRRARYRACSQHLSHIVQSVF